MGRCGGRAFHANGTQHRACEMGRDLVCSRTQVGPTLEHNEGEGQNGRGSGQESDLF